MRALQVRRPSVLLLVALTGACGSAEDSDWDTAEAKDGAPGAVATDSPSSTPPDTASVTSLPTEVPPEDTLGPGVDSLTVCEGLACGDPCGCPRGFDCRVVQLSSYCDVNGECVALPSGTPAPCPGPNGEDPYACNVVDECPPIAGQCTSCPDGVVACPSLECVTGRCVYTPLSCDG